MTITRGDLTDWFVEGAESVVLIGDQVLQLSELATAVVELVGGTGLELEELHRRLVAAFGESPTDDPGAATRAIVAELVRVGVLRATPANS